MLDKLKIFVEDSNNIKRVVEANGQRNTNTKNYLHVLRLNLRMLTKMNVLSH